MDDDDCNDPSQRRGKSSNLLLDNEFGRQLNDWVDYDWVDPTSMDQNISMLDEWESNLVILMMMMMMMMMMMIMMMMVCHCEQLYHW